MCRELQIFIFVFGCKLSLFRLCGSDFGISPVDDIKSGLQLLILLLLLLLLLSSSSSSSSLSSSSSSLSSSSPLCRVFTIIYLKQRKVLECLCCSRSVFTICATCNVISSVKYVLYFYISTQIIIAVVAAAAAAVAAHVVDCALNICRFTRPSACLMPYTASATPYSTELKTNVHTFTVSGSS